MKLTWKIALTIAVVICLVLGVDGYLRVRRQLELFEEDIQRDHMSMGRATAAAVTETWLSHGEKLAMELMNRISKKTSRVKVRWIRLRAEASTKASNPSSETMAEVTRSKQPTSSIRTSKEGVRFLQSLIPVDLRGTPVGVIEISETLAPQKTYVRTTIIRSITTTAIMVIISAATTFFFGLVLVGRPVKMLVEKARSIGRGDFTGRLTLKQNDEIGSLAEEMNAMAARLDRAMKRIETEMTARLETLEQLRHADRLKIVGQLTSGVVHEIGTPLTVIAGRAKMISTGEAVGEEARDSARIAVEQTERVTKTIRQILDFARKGDNKKSIEDVSQIAREITRLLGPVAVKGGVYLKDETQGTPDARAWLDRSQIQQVLANLIVNAVQAANPGGNVTLKLVATKNEGKSSREFLALSVHDDGEGISPDIMDHIFEPFYTTKTTGNGTGLGLAISREIIRDHGGWIDVDSKPGKGSCFTVYIPTEEGNS